MKTRTQIIAELKRYFNVKELVCNHVFAKHGDKSWMFLSTPYLETLLFLRQDLLKVPMVCNTNTLKQRGLRCNLCQIVKDKSAINVSYLSAHVTGSGGDFSSAQMDAEQMRQLIKEHADELPWPVRIERDVNWLHIDVYDDMSTDAKVVEFNG